MVLQVLTQIYLLLEQLFLVFRMDVSLNRQTGTHSVLMEN